MKNHRAQLPPLPPLHALQQYPNTGCLTIDPHRYPHKTRSVCYHRLCVAPKTTATLNLNTSETGQKRIKHHHTVSADYKERKPTHGNRRQHPMRASNGTPAQTYETTFSTKPALIAFTATQTRRTCPFGSLIFTRCRFGLKMRGHFFVTCVPIPPLFFD